MALYADIIVDRHHQNVDTIFTYKVPPEIQEVLCPGMMVTVPFGATETIKGYCLSLSDSTTVPEEKLKSILSCLGTEPALTEENIQLAGFMKQRFGATLSSCLALFVPKKPNTVLKANDQPAPKSALPRESSLILNEEQEMAYKKAIEAMDQQIYKPFLLFGITGSGKTEIYILLAQKAIREGKTAIVLVPEISLTPQLVDMFSARFGEGRVGVIHSKLSDGERSKTWMRAKKGYYDVIIGARSALFAPLPNVGLIVMDEEHESSYQSDQMPKYHTRDVAEKLCAMRNIPLVLGSATPSVESFYRAQSGELTLLKLTKRATGACVPQMISVDMRQELAGGNPGFLSGALQNALQNNLQEGKQSLILLNRRGYAGFVNCRSCGFVLRCPKCFLPYTYHKQPNRNVLICHHCGKTVPMPSACPQCGSTYIRQFGIGTQKVEEELQARFPAARIARMDLNSTFVKNSYEDIYERMRRHEIDILVGTQMIAKGFDFPLVTLVGILSADMCLYEQDYHSAERTFALLVQAAGRSGRASSPGKVVLQSYAPEHYSIACALKQDYEAFYREEITARRMMNVPPFAHLMQVLITGKNENRVRQDAADLAAVMQHFAQGKDFILLGPTPAVLGRIDNTFRWKILIKNTNRDRLVRYSDYCINQFLPKKISNNIISMTLDPDSLE